MRNILTTILILVYVNVTAQQFGAQWVTGPNTSRLDFRIDTIGLDTITGNMDIWETNADICDSTGNLLYYTNGYYIADRNGALLLNGDTLSPSALTNQYYSLGEPLPQAAIFLPMPDSSRYYYLFHFGADTDNRPQNVYYSLIDKEGNGGLGAVVKKNMLILKLHGDTVLRGGGMTACKHANGMDYWLILLMGYSNEFLKFLVTPDSILGPFFQFIGPVFSDTLDLAYSKFSQDGSKYATTTIWSDILVMDFNRCTGEFSNPISLYHNNSNTPGQPSTGSTSLEFSPNGRFIYATNSIDLTQYDLLSDTPQDSIQVWNDSVSDFYQMDKLQAAPNGKIYGSTYSGGLKAFHVINYPDSLGLSCGFVYGGQPTLSLNSFSVPNMINYNLGSLGSVTNATICHGSTYAFNSGTYTNAGVYYDTLTSAGGCDSILTLHLAIFPFSQPQITLTGKDTLATTAFNYYQWLMDGQPITGATGHNYIAADTGDYSVVVTDTNGCYDTSAVFDLNTLAIANASFFEFVNLYPNPARDLINLNFYAMTNGLVNFELIDQLGQPMINQNLGNGQTAAQFSTTQVSSGLYYWSLKDSQRTIQSGIVAIIK